MAAKPPAKRKRREYSPVEIRQALTVVAYFGGNTARASDETGIPQQTLHDWRANSHTGIYLEVAEREGPKLEAIAAQQARETIIRAGEIEHSLLDRLTTRLGNDETTSKELSELAGTLQRVTTSKGINGTKLLELTGRPTQVVEHRDPKQAAEALARRLGVVLTTATDLSETRTLPVSSGLANVREAIPAVSKPAD